MAFSRRLRITLAMLGLALSALLLPVTASASDHGGGGAPEPMVFTLNLGAQSYVMFGLLFETATPEVAHELTVFRPRIQHEIILLMSGQDGARLRTLEGKKALMEEIVELANHIIHEDRKSGVKEILFSKFLIQ